MSTASLQEVFVGSYLQDFQIKHVLGHDTLFYREKTAKFLLLIFLIFFAYRALFQIEYLRPYALWGQWIFSFSILLMLFLALYVLINDYLDVIVITESGLIHFQRHNPLVQTTSVIQRVAIESIQQHRAGLRQTMRGLGNIRIQVEDQHFHFDRIYKPLSSIQQLLHRKSIYTRHQSAENTVLDEGSKPDSYSVLIEALGEVMDEYMKKKSLDH